MLGTFNNSTNFALASEARYNFKIISQKAYEAVNKEFVFSIKEAIFSYRRKLKSFIRLD